MFLFFVKKNLVNNSFLDITIFREHRARLEESNDTRIFLKGTCHLLPCNELCHLFGQLPELLEVDVPIRQPASREKKTTHYIDVSGVYKVNYSCVWSKITWSEITFGGIIYYLYDKLYALENKRTIVIWPTNKGIIVKKAISCWLEQESIYTLIIVRVYMGEKTERERERQK